MIRSKKEIEYTKPEIRIRINDEKLSKEERPFERKRETFNERRILLFIF